MSKTLPSQQKRRRQTDKDSSSFIQPPGGPLQSAAARADTLTEAELELEFLPRIHKLRKSIPPAPHCPKSRWEYISFLNIESNPAPNPTTKEVQSSPLLNPILADAQDRLRFPSVSGIHSTYLF